MNNKKRQGDTPPNPSGNKHNSADDAMSPDWQKEKPSRHKWFRKRKRRKASRRQHLDDDLDDESDVAVAESEPWPYVYYDSQLSADVETFGEEVMVRATEEGVWGIASAIDIYDCDAGLIRDAGAIRRFVAELCDLIGMKTFGETQVVHFGEDERVAGYSMVQLIETSLISAHFANQTNTVYLDVFSCKPYNPEVVREFSQAFFKGQDCSLQVAFRR